MIISLAKYKGSGGEKPTEVLTQTITQNGSQTFEPQEGYVFSSAEITTNIHPTEALIATINENGSRHFDGEYNGADITTDVHPTDKLVETITSNGAKSFSGEWKDAAITVAIPSDQKPEESLEKTITSNGSFHYDPSAGSVFSNADITVDVHPTEALITTINENGSRHFDGEYNGADITVAVETFTPTGNIDINANGSYDVANYATANVNVQVTTKNYSYFDGVIDTEGLRAIGWDDESIGMYRDNERHYAWQNSDYIVSEENKALNGVIVDKTTISNNKGNQNFKYCPFFDTSNVTNMDSMFNDCSSLISIPKIDTSKVTRTDYMFSYCRSLTTIPHIDTSKVTNMASMFYWGRSLTTIPALDTRNVTNMDSMFYGCNSLSSIPLIDTSNVTTMFGIVYGCSSLKYLGGFKNLHISVTSNFLDQCPNLTVESLMNVINNLAKVSGKTLKFGSDNLGKLTAQQKAIATNKGWTLT